MLGHFRRKGIKVMNVQQVKVIIRDFVEEDVILERPKKIKGYERLEDGRRLKFIREFIRLLLYTEFISTETKCYIKNESLQVEGIAKELKIQKNIHTMQTRLWRDLKKLDLIFGKDMLMELMQYDKINIEEYELKLSQAFGKYTNVKALDNLALNLAEGGDGSEVSEEAFDDFISTIKPYLKTHMKSISEDLDINVIAYVRRLLSSTILTEEEQERKELLEMLLNIKKINEKQRDW